MSLEKVTKGVYAKNKKDGKVVKVLGSENGKVTAVVVDTKEEKAIAESTFKRWYGAVETDSPEYAEAVASFEGNSQPDNTPANDKGTADGGKPEGTGAGAQATNSDDKAAGKDKGTAGKGDKDNTGKGGKPEKTEAEKQADADAKAKADADKKAAADAKAKEKADKKAADEKAKADKKAADEKAKADKKAEADKAKAEKKAAAEAARAAKMAEKENKALREPKTPDPVVVGYRDELEAFAKCLGEDITIRDVNTYRGVYAGSRNICEIHLQKKKVKIHVKAESLNSTQLEKCKVVPKSFGWALDAIYNITNTDELAFAKELLTMGKNFRKTVAV